MVQQLSDEDHMRRLDFCLQLQDLNEFRWSFPEKGAVKSRSDILRQRCSKSLQFQNMGIWNPRAYVGHQRDSPKANVFIAISSQKVYGPFFFADETVTGMA